MRLVLLFLFAASAASAQPFVREATPFPVRNAAGEALPFPFTGGFFEPRPSLVDVDGDGDADLILNVGGAGLQLFEKTPAGYVWKTDRLGDVEPGNWAAFGDLDGDGDLDLLTRGEPGRVRYYRNVGSAASPQLALVSALLVASDGEGVAIEDSSIPDLADADGDGDLDLLAGKADLGTITLYRNDGSDASGAPRFTFVTSTYEDVQVYEANPQCGPQARMPGSARVPGERASGDAGGPSAPSMHGANALRLIDLTGDGLPELFWGDFFSPSLYYFGNAGTPADPVFSLVGDRYPAGQAVETGGYNAPAFGDTDGDGDLDLIVGVQRGLCFQVASSVDNLLRFENTGSASTAAYQARTSRLIESIDVGSRATVAAADLDGDGDLDLVIGSESDPGGSGRARLVLYRNTGTAQAPDYTLADADWLALDYDFGGYGPAFGDLDGDGDLDLVVGGFNGRFALLRNTGSITSPQFVLDATTTGNPGFEGVDSGQYARGSLGDVDGDGDLDFVTGASNGRVRLYRNVGTAQMLDFLTEPNGAPQAADLAYALGIGIPDDTGEDSAPTLGDVDGDGDLDLLVGTSTGAIRLFRNTGTAQAPAFTEAPAVVSGRRRAVPLLADLDGDGDADLLAGTDAGGLLFWRTPGGTSAEDAPETGASGLQLRLLPNPSSGSVRLRLNEAVQGEAVVFDVRGREVRRVLLNGLETEWDGRDASGQTLPAGVYTVRIRASGRTATAHVTRV